MTHDDKLYQTVILLFGSWQSIVGHAIAYTLFIMLFDDLLFFTMFLSIEAILIGILILMATNREQAIIDKRTSERRIRDRELVREDVSITNEVIEEIRILKKHQHDSKLALEEIRDLMKTTS
jgi:uncharacterized membrane protein